jgi:hypothetical protein
MEQTITLGAKGRRVDLAVDDFDRRIGVIDVLELMDSDNVATGVMKGDALKTNRKAEFMRGFQEAIRGTSFSPDRVRGGGGKGLDERVWGRM